MSSNVQSNSQSHTASTQNQLSNNQVHTTNSQIQSTNRKGVQLTIVLHQNHQIESSQQIDQDSLDQNLGT